MDGDAAVARWLIVVRRDRPGLFDDLSRAFAGVPQIVVVRDRRERERRAESRAGAVGDDRLRLTLPPVLVFQDQSRG